MSGKYFIVSTGRTGTQAIAQSVARVAPERFLALHEPKPSRRFRLLSNMRMAGLISKSRLSGSFFNARLALFERAGERDYLESNNFIFGLSDILASEYDAQVIHIVRHPLDYAVSHLKHGAFHGAKGAAGLFFPFWLSKPRYKGYEAGSWLAMSGYERLFWVWRLVNEYIEELAGDFRSRYSIFRFEDVFSDVNCYTELLATVGIKGESAETLSREMRKKANQGARETHQINEHEKRRLQVICGELAGKYGYKV